MEIAVYPISSLLTGILFSFVTSMLIVFGIEHTGGDPGSPAIMLVGLICITGILSLITSIIIITAETKSQKEFPIRSSAIIFLCMYLPFHIIGIYFPLASFEFLAIPLTIMMFLSYIPLFHVVTKSLIHTYEFVKR